MDIEYNWLGSLTILVLYFATVALGSALVFQVPALQRARTHNKQENRRKLKSKGHKYQGRMKSSQIISLITNIVFFIAILPFFVTFETQSMGAIALHVFLILMVYDFFYYLIHRFLFHGPGYLLKVHGVHHQARSRVSSVDALLLHPVEVFLGIALYFVVTALLSLLLGTPFHVATVLISSVIYTQINMVNHCRIDLKGFPFSALSWIATNHDSHHINMHKGNYATITLLYDWLFGTLEPLNQPEQIEATQSTKFDEASSDKLDAAV